MKAHLNFVGNLGTCCFIVALLVTSIVGCTLHIAPDYSSDTANAIVSTEKLVDKFYADIRAVPANQRTYKKFSGEYGNVEVEIRSLILRCKIQPLNQNSTKMAETLLDLWQKAELRHEQTDKYGDVLAQIDQERFDGLLTSMALVEQSKKQPVNP